MIKLLILAIAIFGFWAIASKNTQQGDVIRKNTSILYRLHIIVGIAFTIFSTFHGISHLQNATTGGLITGILLIILLYLQLIIGWFLSKNKSSSNKKLKTAHKILPIILVIIVIFHILINKFL